jgi:hypothetical protein
LTAAIGFITTPEVMPDNIPAAKVSRLDLADLCEVAALFSPVGKSLKREEMYSSSNGK